MEYDANGKSVATTSEIRLGHIAKSMDRNEARIQIENALASNGVDVSLRPAAITKVLALSSLMAFDKEGVLCLHTVPIDVVVLNRLNEFIEFTSDDLAQGRVSAQAMRLGRLAQPAPAERPTGPSVSRKALATGDYDPAIVASLNLR